MLPVLLLLGSVRALPVSPLTTCPTGWLGPYTGLGCIKFPDAGTTGVNWNDALGPEASGGCGGFRRVEVPATESGGSFTDTQAQLLYSIAVGYNTLNTLADYLWIGLTDTAKEGEWKWTSGNVSHTEAFSSFFNPTTDTAINCVVMEFKSGSLKWVDEDCSKKVRPSALRADAPVGAICQCLTDDDCYGVHAACEDGWQDSPTLGCVKPMISKDAIDNTNALAGCTGTPTSQPTSYLVEPRSQEKETAVEELAKLYYGFDPTKYGKVWLGLRETATAGSWIWNRKNDGTGDSVIYSNWKGQTPADAAKQCAILETTDGTTWNWVDVDCADATNVYVYICQMSEPDTAPPPECSSPWHKEATEKGCYRIHPTAEAEGTAEASCEALAPEGESAYLVQPTDEELGKELADYVELYAEFVDTWWLGLKYDGSAWRWLSGCDLGAYTNWKAGQPADPSTNGCAVLTKDSTGWVWEARPCTDATPLSMCQKPYNEEDLCITTTADPGATTTTASGGGDCPTLTGTLDSTTRAVTTMTGDQTVVTACGGNYCCDQNREGHMPADWKGPGWYKFGGEFTKMADTAVAIHHCGTVHPGYLVGGHPTEGEGNVTRTVVWGTCGYTSTVTVLSCGGSFLYNLMEAPICYLGYCGV